MSVEKIQNLHTSSTSHRPSTAPHIMGNPLTRCRESCQPVVQMMSSSLAITLALMSWEPMASPLCSLVTLTSTLPALDAQTPHTKLKCSIPSGEGSGFSLRMIVSNQESNFWPRFPTLAYAPPRIESITPAIGNTAGGETIVIIGKNFGVSRPDVFFGVASATSLQTRPATTRR